MSQAFAECNATMIETEKVLGALIRSMCNNEQPSA